MNLKAKLPHTVTHEPKTGESDWGDPTFGPAVKRRAFVKFKQRMVRDAGGNASISDTQIVLGPAPIAVGDRIDAGGGPREIVNYESDPDINGRNLGWVVYL